MARPVTLVESGPAYESRAALEAAPAVDGTSAPTSPVGASSGASASPALGAAPAPRPTGLSDQQAIDRLLQTLPERAATRTAPLIERALRGDVLTHDEWLSVTTLIAAVDPDSRPDILAGADPFVDSLRSWVALPTADTDLTGAILWLAKLIGSAQEKKRRERAQGEEIRAGLAAGKHRPLLVQRNGFLFVADPVGGYQAPLLPKDVDAGLPERLAPWAAMGVVDPFVTVGVRTPRKKPKTARDLIREAGTVADDVVYGHWSIAQFDQPTRELRLPAGALANIEPRFEPEADQYFTLLVGPAAKPKLEDFCAALTQRDRVCAALYLYGPSGTGKNKIVKAMAAQWASSHAVPLDKALQKHNDSLRHCQLVHGDEDFDVEASAFRRLFEDSQTFEPKNQPVATLKCALRVVLTANSGNLIRAERQDEAEGLDATARRIIRLKVDAAAGDYLGSLPYDEAALVAMLARHVAWLRQRGVQNPGKRYAVEPDPHDHAMRNSLAFGDEPTVIVGEVLVDFLAHAGQPQALQDDHVRIGNGAFLVTSQRVWANVRARKQDRFSETLIVEKLGRLAKRGEKRAQGKGPKGSKGPRFYEVDIERILEFADSLGHPVDELRARITGTPRQTAEQLKRQLAWKEAEVTRIRADLEKLEAPPPSDAPAPTEPMIECRAVAAEPDSAAA